MTYARYSDLIKDALMEIGAYAQGETPSAADQNFCLTRLNGILDSMAARNVYVPNLVFTAFTLVPNLSPHTIGPSGATFTMAQRPVTIEGCTIILNTTNPNTEVPVTLRDDMWWNYQTVKNLTSTLPTDLYYSPDYPNGSLYFWPVPTYAYGVRLETWGLLSQVASASTSVSLQPGYARMLMLMLAADCAGPFQCPLDPTFQAKLMEAKKAVQSDNAKSPRISLIDSGQPMARMSGGSRADFNWADGLPGN